MALIRSDSLRGDVGTPVSTYALGSAAAAGESFNYTGLTSGYYALLTAPTAAYVAANYTCKTADGADSDLYVDFKLPSLIEGYYSFALRGPSPSTNYNPSGVFVQLVPAQGYYSVNYADSSGNVTNLANLPFSPVANTLYTLRFRVVGTGVQSKIYPVGTEPAAWDYQGTQTAVTTGTYQTFAAISGQGGTASMNVGNMYVYDAAGVPVTPLVVDGGFMSLLMPPIAAAKPDSAMPTAQTITSNGRTWQVVTAQDFATPAAAGQVRSVYPGMGYYNGQKDTSQQGTYDPDSVLSVANSILTASLRTGVPSSGAQSGGAGTTAVPLVACVMPDNYNQVTYGRASIRFRANIVTAGLGYKLVWFYFPIDNNWNEGEIDAFENDIGPGSRSRLKNATPGSGVDANGGQSSSTGLPPASMSFTPVADLFVPTDMTDWHTATVEWGPGYIAIYWDGQLTTLLTNEKGVVIPTSVMNFKLQMETVIQEGTVSSAAAAQIDIDWVVTYRMLTWYVTDSFTDTAGTSLTAHKGELGATWTNYNGTSGSALITPAGRVRHGNTVNTALVASGLAPTADCAVEADFTWLSVISEAVSIGVRNNTSANTGYRLAWSQSSGAWGLSKVIGGTSTLLGTWPFTPTIGQTYHMKLRAVGTSLVVTLNGVDQTPIIDNGITANGPGNLNFSGSAAASDTTGVHVDNYQLSA